MPTEWKQKRFSQLTLEQQKAKLEKDLEYEQAVKHLSTPFYQKKRTVGVTPEEQAAYDIQKATLWNNYLDWAKANGLYEQVSPEQQLAEREERLALCVQDVNAIRGELGKRLIELREI